MSEHVGNVDVRLRVALRGAEPGGGREESDDEEADYETPAVWGVSELMLVDVKRDSVPVRHAGESVPRFQ